MLSTKLMIFGVGAFFLMTLAGVGTCYAQENSAEDGYVPKQDYEKLKREVEVLKAQMRSLLKKVTASEQALKPGEEAPAPQAEMEPSETDDPVASLKAEAGSATEEGSQATDNLGVAEGSREKEAEESRRALDTFLRGQKVLFKPGELVLEFNLAYSEDTTEDLNVKLSARSANASLLARYGLAEDLEFDLTVPYGYIEQEVDFRPFMPIDPDTGARQKQVNRTDSVGIGDISAALRYTAWRESGYIPSITLNLNAKSRTGDASKGLGSGFWNVGGAVTALKTVDPVVFFGSLGYTATLERQGTNPGDQISYSFGTGFSLNDRVSFLGSLVGGVVRRSEIERLEISTRNIASAQFSATIQLTKRLFVEPFVAFGLTEEAPDFQAGLTVPYRFEGRFPLPFFHY